MSDRIKGQEVSIIITSGGELETELTDIKSVEFSYEFEQKNDKFLGEKTIRVDQVFNGIKGGLEMHLHDGSLMLLAEKIKAKATRRQPDLVFNITGVFSFPSGETKTMTVADVAWGAIPLSVSGSAEFVSGKLDFIAPDATVDDD